MSNLAERYTGLYTTDTFDVTSQLSVTFGGRYNIAQIGLRDTLGNNAGLNGDHGYSIAVYAMRRALTDPDTA